MTGQHEACHKEFTSTLTDKHYVCDCDCHEPAKSRKTSTTKKKGATKK